MIGPRFSYQFLSERVTGCLMFLGLKYMRSLGEEGGVAL